MSDLHQELPKIELFAWVGEDEFGSGEVGLKQGVVPAGVIPLVAVRKEKMLQCFIQSGLQAQSTIFKRQIRLCRFVYVETIVTLNP